MLAEDLSGLPQGVVVVVDIVTVEDIVPPTDGVTDVGFKVARGQFEPGHVPTGPPETAPRLRLTTLAKAP